MVELKDNPQKGLRCDIVVGLKDIQENGLRCEIVAGQENSF